MERKKKIKIIIIVLAVLLAISLAALCTAVLYNKFAGSSSATVAVPDNLITPDADNENSQDRQGETALYGDGSVVSVDSSDSSNGEQYGLDSLNPSENSETAPSNLSSDSSSDGAEKKATAIELYKNKAEDNTAFAVGNMFPGDEETKYYCVNVSFHDEITVHYKATVRPGYEKLAEVMKIRVELLDGGGVLYDGLMADMPESVTHTLASEQSTTDSLYYEITAYLDTSVGNDYQNKNLVADFKWWVEDDANLDAPPKTGDGFDIALLVALAVVSGLAIILILVFTRRKEERQNG